MQLREQSTTTVASVSRRFIHGESRTHQKCKRGDPADHIPIHCFLPSVSEFLVRSSTHTLSNQKPSPGSPVGSSIGDHHRNFRTRKIGALRNVCGPRDFVDKVTLARGVSIAPRPETRQKFLAVVRAPRSFRFSARRRVNLRKPSKTQYIFHLIATYRARPSHPKEWRVGQFVTGWVWRKQANNRKKRLPIFPKSCGRGSGFARRTVRFID
ncbi:hypothetical protein Mal15_51880 [Stieleria maiorica]|uniref:Uncharacterized protein n=1 Tax=Stieleria maiorica TaxID=2795974 RepID=A0A5B9MIP2_9BACT|nr:hypothetical protein Mal15_51880 [Stieleria maiorica]